MVAEVADLAGQAGEAAVAAAGVLVGLGLEGVGLAGPASGPAVLRELLPGPGAVVALDGMRAPARVAGDLPQAAALGPQAVDQLVPEPCPPGGLPRWLMLAVRRQGRGGVVAGNGDGRLGQAAPAGE